MKKYIYSLFMMILAVGGMISCSEEEGTNPGNVRALSSAR